MKLHNIFSEIPKNLKREIFDILIKNDTLTIERIISKGQQSSSWHDQKENEWVMVLKGEAVLTFEDQTSVPLKEGDFINIPSHKKHRVSWTDPGNETIWLAIHY
ncbi:MAG: cupin domain-containing protein [Nitrosomonas sp.]|uniref:cupin domain-containing protein n=1 Tax=Nitrosomonas sp. TaxID=42353 RepID=UPI0025F45746|nr:cupin domain-containing protein [Nitrosomonas sp.]MBY0475004.1 cupin domain-containing protein [Nitrosomonas sp.]